MAPQLPTGILRPELTDQASFSVSEIPHRAKLDQNESPFDIPAEIKDQILSWLARSAWNRYPQPRHYVEVKERFAACLGLDPARVVLTAGCDQVIQLAYWVAGGQGRRARVFEPTYPMYNHYARITRTDLDRVVLGPDFAVADEGPGALRTRGVGGGRAPAQGEAAVISRRRSAGASAPAPARTPHPSQRAPGPR